MNIVINGQNLQKRIINGQEVEKVIRNGVQIRPESVPPTPTEDYLCFTSRRSGGSVAFYKHGNPYEVQLETSRDKIVWSDYTFGTEIILSDTGDKVYFRNKSETVTGFSTTATNYYTCWPIYSGASGDINYLLCKNSTRVFSQPLHENCFYHLFSNSSLLTAPSLPATTLADYCYQGMFNDCRNMNVPPSLPATTLAEGCYLFMFRYCEALTTIPQLPATTLADYCYEGMFDQCRGIRMSETQDEWHQTPYRIPTSGEGSKGASSLSGMFSGTGGTFTGTPTINTTYYTSNDII